MTRSSGVRPTRSRFCARRTAVSRFLCRDHGDVELLGAPDEGEAQGDADAVFGHQFVEVVDVADGLAVGLDDDVALEQPGARGGAAGFDADDHHAGFFQQLVEADDAAVERHVLPGNADRAAPDAAVADEPRGDELRGGAGDGEANALRAGDDGGIDANHLPISIYERPAAVAGVEAASVWMMLSMRRPVRERNERAR